MSDTMRWRYGETSPVMLAIDSATVVEIGDLILLDTGKAKPAGLQADQASESADQVAFHAKFTGVAMQRSRAGETNPIRVATSGVFEFPCASAVFEVGDLLGPTVRNDRKITSVFRSGRRALSRAAGVSLRGSYFSVVPYGGRHGARKPKAQSGAGSESLAGSLRSARTGGRYPRADRHRQQHFRRRCAGHRALVRTCGAPATSRVPTTVFKSFSTDSIFPFGSILHVD